MREFYYDLQIDKKPILVPDADVQVEFSNLESEDSGRDESGFMHRIVLRRGIRTWALSYGILSAEEYRYMESLFAGKDQFLVDYLDGQGRPASCIAYRCEHSLAVHNAAKGIYKNYQFSINEC
jgi:hypothetical protein